MTQTGRALRLMRSSGFLTVLNSSALSVLGKNIAKNCDREQLNIDESDDQTDELIEKLDDQIDELAEKIDDQIETLFHNEQKKPEILPIGFTF